MSIIENEKVTFDFVYRDENNNPTPVKFFYDANDEAKIQITGDTQHYIFSAKMLEEVVGHLKSRGALRPLKAKAPKEADSLPILNKDNQYQDFIGQIDTSDVPDEGTFVSNLDSMFDGEESSEDDFDVASQLDAISGKAKAKETKQPPKNYTREELDQMAQERKQPKKTGKEPPKPVSRKK